MYNPYTGAYGVGHAVYGPYGSSGTAAWYNPSTGAYGRAVTTQNAYGGHTYAQGYNPWTGTYAATSQGHNQYSQWGSSVVTNGDNWAQAQHVTNSNGTAGSFQTSKESAGAGFSGANGNGGFVAKDANNNNIYAGADGNVYKKDSSGNWSKYDNGGWTSVDPSIGANQTRQQKTEFKIILINCLNHDLQILRLQPRKEEQPLQQRGERVGFNESSRCGKRNSEPANFPLYPSYSA
ncbi:hypothetical protein [Tunturiibacter gelidoferens]|uniref:Uncharacterized protein n=1 Tax=Tunturiibacter gelidiferens TaxID=3069689 RepID=A0A9X0U3X6_9BACT|nr:hypothetical protein [Edaphobacter lichenicola]MBB5328809.1 hypothetical protein [Edaphobacter lichenicola]